MDQPDDANFPFEYDIDEAVRQYQEQYPCEGNAEGSTANQAAEADCRLTMVTQHMSGHAAGSFCTSPAPTAEITLQRGPEYAPATEVDLFGTYNIVQLPDAYVHSNLAPNAEFRFQSGAIRLDENEVAKKPIAHSTQNGLKCEWPNCKYRGTFGRKAELQRHMRKHTNEGQCRCPIVSCGRSFYRQDKIFPHLKQAHKDDEDAKCPIPGCKAPVLSWHALRHHGLRSHYAYDGVIVIRVIREIGVRNRFCPIRSCRNPMVSASEMQAHIQAHAVQERQQNSHAISNAGYHAISTKFICPVCANILSTLQDLANHVEDFHISAHSNHLRKFRTSLLGATEKWYRRPIDEERSFELCWRPTPIPLGVKMPKLCCGEDPSEPAERYHHIQLLQDPESFRPYRFAILRMWPEFQQHPIFDDVWSSWRV